MSDFQKSKTVENSKRKRESDIFEEVPKRYKKFHEYIVENDLVLDEEKFCNGFENCLSVDNNENEKKALDYINTFDKNFNIQKILEEEKTFRSEKKVTFELYENETNKKIEDGKNFVIASLQLMCLDDD